MQKMTMKDNVSLKMTSNAFGIHWSAGSKVIHDVFLAIVKHLASKLVRSASFTVLKSSSVPKSSYFYIFLSVIMFKTLKFSVLLKSSQFICPCKLLFFSSILHLYCVCHFFWKSLFKASFHEIEGLFTWVCACVLLWMYQKIISPWCYMNKRHT